MHPRPFCTFRLSFPQNKKHIAEYSTREWRTFGHEVHVPQQANDSDCGVFTCICADFVSEDLEFLYNQDDMGHFREKICADILRGSLSYPV